MGKEQIQIEAARAILQLRSTEREKRRMQALAAKARDGALTPDELEEVDAYERVGNLLALLKSKARRRLNNLDS
jgi:hypothetical protein